MATKLTKRELVGELVNTMWQQVIKRDHSGLKAHFVVNGANWISAVADLDNDINERTLGNALKNLATENDLDFLSVSAEVLQRDNLMEIKRDKDGILYQALVPPIRYPNKGKGGILLLRDVYKLMNDYNPSLILQMLMRDVGITPTWSIDEGPCSRWSVVMLCHTQEKMDWLRAHNTELFKGKIRVVKKMV